MSLNFIEVTPCAAANATLHEGAVNFAVRCGFDGVRADIRFNTYGTDPDDYTANRTSFAALLNAIAPTDLKAVFTLYPTVTQNAAWTTKQGGSESLITQRPSGNALDDVAAGWQSMVNYARTIITDESRIAYQIANECGIGGAGGPNDAGNGLKSELTGLGHEGVWDNNAFWDSADAATAWSNASLTGSAANIKGIHEILDYLLANVDFYGHFLWGPALEDEAEFTVQTGSSGILRTGHTWYSAVDGFTFNVYGGINDAGTLANYWRLSPQKFGELVLFHAQRSANYFRTASVSAGKPLMVTETGASKGLIGQATKGRLNSTFQLGRYRRAALEACRILDIYGVSVYGGRSDAAGTDSNQAGNYFGMESGGNWNYGALELAAANGVILSTASSPPGTAASWVGISGEASPPTAYA